MTEADLPPPAAARPQPAAFRAIGLFVVVGLLAVYALHLACPSYSVGDIAPAAAASAIPLLAIIGYLRMLSSWRRPPLSFYLVPLSWGASMMPLLTITLERVARSALPDDLDRDVLTAVVVAPIVEEVLKGIIVLAVLRAVRHLIVDTTITAVLLSALSAAGFAFIENVGYVVRAVRAGPDTETAVILGRLVLMIGNHPQWTVLIGLAGAMAWTRDGRFRGRVVLLGLISAIVLHGLWNYFVHAGIGPTLTYYLMVQLPMLVLILIVLQYRRAQTGRILHRRLPLLLERGLVTPWEAARMLVLLDRRRLVQLAGVRFGQRGRHQMGNWQRCVVDLAVLYDRGELTDAEQLQLTQRLDRLASLRLALASVLDDPDGPGVG